MKALLTSLFATMLTSSSMAASVGVPAMAPEISLLKVLLALALVIAAIFSFGWLYRRFGMSQRSTHDGDLKLLAAMHLSPRERVVLIGVGGQQVLVGVSAAGMTRLGQFDGDHTEAVKNTDMGARDADPVDSGFSALMDAVDKDSKTNGQQGA